MAPSAWGACAKHFHGHQLDTAHAKSMRVYGLLGTRSNPRVIRQPQVVVSAEVKYALAALDLDLGALRARDHSLRLVGARLLDRSDG